MSKPNEVKGFLILNPDEETMIGCVFNDPPEKRVKRVLTARGLMPQEFIVESFKIEREGGQNALRFTLIHPVKVQAWQHIDELSGVLQLTAEEKQYNKGETKTVMEVAEHVLKRRSLWPPGFVLEKYDLVSGERLVLRYKLREVGTTATESPPPVQEHPTAHQRLDAMAERWPAAIGALIEYLILLEHDSSKMSVYKKCAGNLSDALLALFP